jgi:hypothetical protein
MTSFDPTKSSFDEKISLNVSARLVNPAWQAGVLTSRPPAVYGGSTRNLIVAR